MSVSVNVKAFSGKESSEFRKHYAAVKFCIENELSFPKETSAFFKGKVEGDSLENFNTISVLRMIENGIEIPLKTTTNRTGGIIIKVSDIPSSVDEIIVQLS